MNYDTRVKGATTNRGFVALMATIIISLVLLVMVVDEGTSGWYARFNILGTESKEQASSLAEGCADQALAALVTNPTYAGDSTSTTPGGVCHVFPIQFNTPASGLVTISTQAQVRGSFANLAAVMNLASVHLGSTPASPTRGTLIVYTHVINDNGGAKSAGDFTENVSASVPSKFLFGGSEGGIAVTMNPGAYSISQNPITGYNQTLSTGCSGTIAAGDVKSCVITNDDVLTTLTVIANVINNNGGIHTVSDFILYIDGVAKTPGQPYVVAVGPHTVSGTNLPGYTASAWGYNCGATGSITINSGDNKTCIITYDDNPPAAPACADTVMMLDRSGSMFTNPAWIPDEKTAAKTLVDLYSGVSIMPKVGVGRFDDVATGLSSDLVSQLTTGYAALKTAIDNGLPQFPASWTNLAAAITVGNAELNSVRHTAGNAKVLILVSDGEPNQPSTAAADTGLQSPSANIQNATGDSWTNPTNAYTAADAGADANDVISSGNRHRFYNFNFPTIPTGSTIAGVEADASAWATAVGASSNLTLTPNSQGTYDQWTQNTGTHVSAVGTNDADTSYIDNSVAVETFAVANAGIPAGSTINSVTLTAVAKGTAAGVPLQLVVENGGAPNVGPTNSLTTSYATYTRVMTTNPLTGAAWTLAEVNAWTTKFGVRTTAGASLPRVTQLSVTVNYSAPSSSTLAPTGVGNYDQWSANTGTKTNAVQSNDADTTYINQSTNSRVETYAVSNASIPAGATITGVTVNVVARSDTSFFGLSASLAIRVENGTTAGHQSDGSTQGLTTGYASYSRTLNTNPLTGAAWTLADIGSTKFGIVGTNSIFGAIPRVTQLSVVVNYTTGAANTTLAPTALGNWNQWTPNTGTDVAAVASSDSDTSYIDNSVSVDTFGAPNSAITAGSTINSVTLTAVAKGTAAGVPLQLVVENGGAPNVGPTNSLTTSYATYTRVMTTNPLTGAAWTLAEVNAWTTKFGVRTTAGASLPRVTQLSVTVNYSTPSTACQLGVDLSWNGGTSWTSEKTQTLTNTEAVYAYGGSTDTWSGHTWALGDFSNTNFRARVHAIDPGSSCANTAIDHLDLLQMRVYYNAPSDPTTAALNAADAAKVSGTEIFTIHFGDAAGQPLLAQLASGSTPNPGHQPGSYADPGGVTNGTLTAPATTNIPPNQFTNPTLAFLSDNSYTTDTVNGHQQGLGGFALTVPPGASITGVEVDTEAKSTRSTGCQVGAEVSYDGGATWSATGNKFSINSTSDKVYTLGGSAVTWNHSWVAADLAANKFAVRLQNIQTGFFCPSGTLSVDQVQAKVYYTVNTENGDGDDFFIAPTSADMAGIFNFIGAQVCPAASTPVATPPPTTATLLVTTVVTNDSGTGNLAPSNFTANVSGTNVSPSSFAGSTSGTTVTVDPGTYSVTETGVSGYTERPSATCSSDSAGPIAAGETRVCTLVNDDIPPPPPPNLTITTGSYQEVPTGQ